MKIPFGRHFDQMEFFEFLWLYERLAKQKEKENENNINNSGTSMKMNQQDVAQDMLKSEGLM